MWVWCQNRDAYLLVQVCMHAACHQPPDILINTILSIAAFVSCTHASVHTVLRLNVILALQQPGHPSLGSHKSKVDQLTGGFQSHQHGSKQVGLIQGSHLCCRPQWHGLFLIRFQLWDCYSGTLCPAISHGSEAHLLPKPGPQSKLAPRGLKEKNCSGKSHQKVA